MTKQEVPLRDVLKDAKNELDEARRELERAREQIQSQRQSLQQELDSLSKLREQAAAEKTAVEKLSEEFRGDWDSLQAGLLTFGQTAQELQKRQEDVVQLVRSKDDDLKAALKNINESIASFKSVAAELGELKDQLGQIRSGREQEFGVLESRRQELSSSLETLKALASETASEHARIVTEISATSTGIAKATETAGSVKAGLDLAARSLQAIENSIARDTDASRQLRESLMSLHGSAQTLSDQMNSLAERLGDAKAKDEEEMKGISESLRQDFDQFAASMKSMIEGLDTEATRARSSRAQIVDALGRVRQGLAASLGAMDRLSKESTKEYAEAAGLLAATIKEMDAQRDELNASAQRLKATAEQLQAERMALDERLGALRAEREKRAAARKKGVCPSCGRRVGSADTFCDRCGESLV